MFSVWIEMLPFSCIILIYKWININFYLQPSMHVPKQAKLSNWQTNNLNGCKPASSNPGAMQQVPATMPITVFKVINRSGDKAGKTK